MELPMWTTGVIDQSDLTLSQVTLISDKVHPCLDRYTCHLKEEYVHAVKTYEIYAIYAEFMALQYLRYMSIVWSIPRLP